MYQIIILNEFLNEMVNIADMMDYDSKLKLMKKQNSVYKDSIKHVFSPTVITCVTIEYK